jgi:hypothetical protein
MHGSQRLRSSRSYLAFKTCSTSQTQTLQPKLMPTTSSRRTEQHMRARSRGSSRRIRRHRQALSCWIAYGWVALSTALDGFALGGYWLAGNKPTGRLRYGVDELLNEKEHQSGGKPHVIGLFIRRRGCITVESVTSFWVDSARECRQGITRLIAGANPTLRRNGRCAGGK